jgi:hypothetical protein
MKSFDALSFEHLATTSIPQPGPEPKPDLTPQGLVRAGSLVELPPKRPERVCNHRADSHHLPPREEDFREAIFLRATTPYQVSLPTSRWGINE